ncbi:pyridoxamine 5'-phosphate oxidase [Micromonospora sp. KC606]|uniref:pyridoxamine 5'-phosphate oxidase family protein n=1 Tax=Micromonospora sp. KC606 TaxID=2530379 RepID=UPI00104E3B8F|nr:pyridoxamine 5'-phosphate oxidase family protein [Micromonospora sp. KC606]TDC81793.1 pyridoxamine 5'-phosphate oxidase [Micromonospora sp. KC606]
MDQLVPVDVQARLRQERNVWLCTLRRDGSPHVTPVWFVRDDGAWWIGCDDRSVKARYVLADPRVSLALGDGTTRATFAGRRREGPVPARGPARTHVGGAVTASRSRPSRTGVGTRRRRSCP